MVISLMRNKTKYTDIEKYLIYNHGRHSFYYSNAHIQDLKNDKTDNKYLDLEYIGKYLGNNYLCKIINKPTMLYNCPPISAFEDEIKGEEDGFASMGDIFNNPFIKNCESLLNFPLDISGIINFDSLNIPNEFKTYLENIIENTKHFSLENLYNNQMAYQEQLQNNPKLFKWTRRIVKENANLFVNGKFNKDNIIHDKIFLKDNSEMTFLEYIITNTNIHTNNKDDIFQLFFINGFTILNILGLDNEKNEKVQFTNTINDGLHSYYASYCDILVSNDAKMKEKANIMYELFSIKTEIVDPADFIDFISNDN